MQYVYLNGQTVPYDQAKLHISDLGLRRGYAAFEFFRIVQGVPLFLSDHLGRFERTAQLLDLPVPLQREALVTQIDGLIRLNAIEHGGLQMILTGGYSADAFTPGTPNLIITPSEVRTPPAHLYQQGGKALLHHNLRELAEAKSTDYLVAVKLSQRVRAEGATEVIYHHGQTVYEGSRSSLCLIKDGQLYTAQDGVLMGVTRKQMLEVAQPLLPIHYQTLSLKQLFEADEVILTGATRQVMPITRIEDHRVGNGQVGPYSQALMLGFAQQVQAYIAHALQAQVDEA